MKPRGTAGGFGQVDEPVEQARREGALAQPIQHVHERQLVLRGRLPRHPHAEVVRELSAGRLL